MGFDRRSYEQDLIDNNNMLYSRKETKTEDYRIFVFQKLEIVEHLVTLRIVEGNIATIDIIDYVLPYLEEIHFLKIISKPVFSRVQVLQNTIDKNFKSEIDAIYNLILTESYGYLSNGESKTITEVNQSIMLIRKIKYLKSRLDEKIPSLQCAVSSKFNPSVTTSEVTNESEE